MTAITIKKPAGGLKPIHLGAVCILGLGITGKAVVRFFLLNRSLYSALTVYAGPSSPDNLAFAQEMPSGVTVIFDAEQVGGSYDICVVSPGIPPHTELYRSARAACTEIISEPELAWRLSPQNWIAITGTNGKTTTTALVTHILNQCGVPARAVGNIGLPCIEVVQQRTQGEWLVAELSSYQLHATSQLAPAAAVLLNITPDHLSWHGSHQNYSEDKLKIFAQQKPGDLAVLDTSIPVLAAQFAELQKQGLTPLSLSDISLPLQDVDVLPIKGPHNLANAKAASAVADHLGLSRQNIAAALASFVPLEHRFALVGTVDGVAFINDSKATNTDAAIAALHSFKQDHKVIALFGGSDKGTNLDELVQASCGTVKMAICYGEAGERFAAAFAAFYEANSASVMGFAERGIARDNTTGAVDSGTQSQGWRLVPHLADAFNLATTLALPGDTVLLAPACASFDEFNNFEQRGTVFVRLVEGLASQKKAN